MASNNSWCIHIFRKKNREETLQFSGGCMFLKIWNNEIIASKILLPKIILTPTYHNTKARKHFVPTKFCQSFKLRPWPPYNTQAIKEAVVVCGWRGCFDPNPNTIASCLFFLEEFLSILIRSLQFFNSSPETKLIYTNWADQ